MNPVVLVAEDDPGIIKLFEFQLDDFSFKIIIATTLADAFKKLAKERIDVIILDLTLPDSKGESTLKKVIEKYPDIPIVVITGTDINYEKILALGAQDFFLKPGFSFKDLTRAVKYAIERHKIIRSFQQNLQEAKLLIEELRAKTHGA